MSNYRILALGALIIASGAIAGEANKEKEHRYGTGWTRPRGGSWLFPFGYNVREWGDRAGKPMDLEYKDYTRRLNNITLTRTSANAPANEYGYSAGLRKIVEKSFPLTGVKQIVTAKTNLREYDHLFQRRPTKQKKYYVQCDQAVLDAGVKPFIDEDGKVDYLSPMDTSIKFRGTFGKSLCKMIGEIRDEDNE